MGAYASGMDRYSMFAFSLLKLDIQTSSPFSLSYAPTTKGSTISTACSQRNWPTLHETGYRIVTNGESGNCLYPPTAKAFDRTTAPIDGFGATGATLLDAANQSSMRVSSVRTVVDTTYVLSVKVEPGVGATTKTYTMSSIALRNGALKQLPMGKAQTPDEVTTFGLHFSEPHADGRLLAIRSTGTVPCIVAVLPSGDLDPSLPETCLNYPTDADGRYAGGTFLEQGFAVVALGTESSLWTSADGATLSAKATLPTLVGGPTAEIVHVFAAPNRRILVLTTEADATPWSIKRFWL
ncbi:MAG: hypothetical protein EOP08_01175 [Proteobacteria bacterium]|nr:MAG: hypothetical protein EOP08_01175 [Pseudomonadota bacterium]